MLDLSKIFQTLGTKQIKNRKFDDAYLLFDIGGTHTRMAVSLDGYTIGSYRIMQTPSDPEDGLALIRETAMDILKGTGVRAAAGGIAGVLEADRSKLYRSPHLPLWEGTNLGRAMGEMFQAPVYIENDAAIAGLGEAIRGAGKGYLIVAYFTISTGIGGVRVVSGVLDQKAYGFEPGHQIINADFAKTGIGELEEQVSGWAIEKKFGMPAALISDKRVRIEVAERLAIGIYNSILHWSPDVVVLGGSLIIGENPIPIETLESELRELLSMYPAIPQIKTAQLGQLSGLYGALSLISSEI